MRMKRQISIINTMGQKINSRKLINECELKESSCTVQRYLRKTGYKYKRLSNRIHLNEIHKVKRVNSIKSWICSIGK